MLLSLLTGWWGGEVECVTIDSTQKPFRNIFFFLKKVIFFVLDLIRLGLLLLLLFWPVCREGEPSLLALEQLFKIGPGLLNDREKFWKQDGCLNFCPSK
jgi:hypothetical protein